MRDRLAYFGHIFLVRVKNGSVKDVLTKFVLVLSDEELTDFGAIVFGIDIHPRVKLIPHVIYHLETYLLRYYSKNKMKILPVLVQLPIFGCLQAKIVGNKLHRISRRALLHLE